MSKISQHISLAEAINSTTAIRLGIDNTPNEEQIVNIYALNDPQTNSIRYIGKTKHLLSKRLKQHLYCNHQSHKTYWISSLKKKNLIPTIELLDIVPNGEWQFWEKHYISLYKSWGFDLVNNSIGGSGGDFISFMPNKNEIYKKISEANKGKIFSVEHRRHISESRKNLTAWNKGLNQESNASVKKYILKSVNTKKLNNGKSLYDLNCHKCAAPVVKLLSKTAFQNKLFLSKKRYIPYCKYCSTSRLFSDESKAKTRNSLIKYHRNEKH